MYDQQVATTAAATLERPQPQPSPGWYPVDDFQQRYWDGSSWTTHFAPLTAYAPPTPQAPPRMPSTNGHTAVRPTPGAPNGGPPPSGGSDPKSDVPWWKRPWVIVTGTLVAVAIIGTAGALAPTEESGKGGGSSPEKAAAPAPPKTIELSVVAPDDGATIRAKTVTVRGRVSPADATVDVNGETVQAKKGRFSHRVTLDLGENDISVFANRDGYEDATFAATVTRERSAAEKEQIRERRRQREIEKEQRRQERIAAQTQTFSGSGSKNIGSIEVETDSILEWTNNDDASFRQMLIYDDDFGINVTSDAASGDSVVPAGSYPNITVAGGSSWTITIRPR